MFVESDAAGSGAGIGALTFGTMLENHGLTLARRAVETVQVNVGKRCNQACGHCHVDAGPLRTEAMDARTAERLMDLLTRSPEVATVDLTGGAPELHPLFRDLVVHGRQLGKRIVDRCNLTVLFEPGQEDTGQFLRDNAVEIVASLPCYTEEMVDRQRGHGVFSKSVEALLLLNSLGYGVSVEAPSLSLVYNPVGAVLPPPQAELEAKYKDELLQRFGIRFTRLYTLTNMPIKRFLHQLDRDGQCGDYERLLVTNFNAGAARQVMCTSMISVGWDGQLYDCDFHQMEDLTLSTGRRTLWDIASFAELAGDRVTLAQHCYGCTAGAGSSCQGALA